MGRAEVFGPPVQIKYKLFPLDAAGRLAGIHLVIVCKVIPDEILNIYMTSKCFAPTRPTKCYFSLTLPTSWSG